MNVFKVGFFTFIIALITLSSCSSIPKIQTGDSVQRIFSTKVLLENGDNLKLTKQESTEKTTIILVRHAEKMKDQEDPNLTVDGEKRAEKLKEILSTISLNQVFSSNYNRTLQTAKPTSSSQNLSVKSYDPRALLEFGSMLLKNHHGENILVVGHSNTTPTLLNFLVGEQVVESISESDYGNLFIVTIDKEKVAKAILLTF